MLSTPNELSTCEATTTFTAPREGNGCSSQSSIRAQAKKKPALSISDQVNNGNYIIQSDVHSQEKRSELSSNIPIVFSKDNFSYENLNNVLLPKNKLQRLQPFNPPTKKVSVSLKTSYCPNTKYGKSCDNYESKFVAINDTGVVKLDKMTNPNFYVRTCLKIQSEVAREKNGLEKREPSFPISQNSGDLLLSKLKLTLGIFNEPKTCKNDGAKINKKMDSRTMPLKINHSIIYAVCFMSTATLHCVIFNFCHILRYLLQIQWFPFGILILFCWLMISLCTFIGGCMGEYLQDRMCMFNRGLALWFVAVMSFQCAEYQVLSQFFPSSLWVILTCACALFGHSAILPNVIALGTPTNQLFEANSLHHPIQNEQKKQEKCERDYDVKQKYQAPYREKNVQILDNVPNSQYAEQIGFQHNLIYDAGLIYFAKCQASILVATSFIQLYFFCFVRLDLPHSAPFQVQFSRVGYWCMMISSIVLLTILVRLLLQLLSCTKSSENVNAAPECTNNRNAMYDKYEIPEPPKWYMLHRHYLIQILCKNGLKGYLLLLSNFITIIGYVLSIIFLLLCPASPSSIRIATLLLSSFGWCLNFVVTLHQMRQMRSQYIINDKKELDFEVELSDEESVNEECDIESDQYESDSDGDLNEYPSRESLNTSIDDKFIDYGFAKLLKLIHLGTAATLGAFLRAHLFTVFLIQMCQMKLDVPWTLAKSFNPELLYSVSGTLAMLFWPVTILAVRRISYFKQYRNGEHVSSCMNFMYYGISKQLILAYVMFLLAVYISSLVEIYRAAEQTIHVDQYTYVHRGKLPTNFSFLWALFPNFVLQITDYIFRVFVSLDLFMHQLRKGPCFGDAARILFNDKAFSVESEDIYGWQTSAPQVCLIKPNLQQAIIALFESYGYAAALLLTSVLSNWLFQKSSSDLSLLLLLYTSGLTCIYILVKHFIEK